MLAAVAVALIVVVGRFLVGPLMRLAAKTGSREAVVAIALFLAIGMALITDAVGLSAALGAFLAGLLIGESEYRHQVEVDIEPFKGLLLGLFFMTVGMTFDPSVMAAGFVVIVASVIGLVVIKERSCSGWRRFSGWRRRWRWNRRFFWPGRESSPSSC